MLLLKSDKGSKDKFDMKVIVLPEAQDDIVDIYFYVARYDSVGKADVLVNKLEEKCTSLQYHPDRGHRVPELQKVYIEGFKEIHFKPYRIIYQISSETVFIHAIIDGRRDLHELLERRLLR